MKPKYLAVILGVGAILAAGFFVAAATRSPNPLDMTCAQISGDVPHRLPAATQVVMNAMGKDVQGDTLATMQVVVMQRCSMGSEQTMRQIADDATAILRADTPKGR